VTRWANYVKSNPGWKEAHNEFIDAQISKRMRMIRKLAQAPNGKRKLMSLFGINSVAEYKRLFG